jgi:hypothetical protein
LEYTYRLSNVFLPCCQGRLKMAQKKINVGNIKDVRGEISIAGDNIYTGYTAEQVSLLLQQITSTLQPNLLMVALLIEVWRYSKKKTLSYSSDARD